MTATWPAVLTAGDVSLRPLRKSDARVWRELRAQNYAWLEPWEATSPVPGGGARSFRAFVDRMSKEAKAGRALPWVVEYRGEFVGQLTVSGIVYGSMRSGAVGYWISRHVAGRGIMPTAVAMATDHCMGALGLHRVEIVIRPENAASLRVVEKLGFREEGMRLRFLHIAGQWADHRCFALTSEEVPNGLLGPWLERCRAGTR